jgi:hypothetical protein
MCLVCSMEWKCSRSRLEHVVYLLACSHSVLRPKVIADACLACTKHGYRSLVLVSRGRTGLFHVVYASGSIFNAAPSSIAIWSTGATDLGNAQPALSLQRITMSAQRVLRRQWPASRICTNARRRRNLRKISYFCLE